MRRQLPRALGVPLRTFAALTVLGIGLTMPARTASAAKVSIAVMDLKGRGVDPVAVGALTTEVTNTLASLRVFNVISGEDIKRLLTFEETKQACTGEADAACLAEIGGALGVDQLVYGEVAKIADTYSISLVLLDTQKAQAINRANRKVEAASQLLKETSAVTRALVGPVLESQRGFLVLECAEREANVKIDGITIGVTPLAGRVELSMGPHEITVEKGGFMTWARTVDVLAAEIAVESVSLVPNSEFIKDYESSARRRRAFAWITAGTSVALLTTAGVLKLIGDARFDDLVTKGYLTQQGCSELVPAYNGTDYCPTSTGLENGAVDTVSSIETTDTVALSLAIAGGVSAVSSVILFATGDDPSRYNAYSAKVAGTDFSMTPYVSATGDAGLLLGGRF